MSADGGSKAIAAALTANLGIAVAKFVAFAFTGSASMMAEGVHSIADSGNQGLLILGRRRAKREPTREHPFGYGRERFFYAFVVAVILFTVGALFSLYEGWHKVSDPHPVDSPVWAFAVLGLGILLEGYSFRTAVKESNQTRGRQNWVSYIQNARAPELPVVILEDFAALIGLAVALVCVGLAVITGNGVWDGVGSIAIGVLLAFIAIVLAVETKSMLIGESAVRETEDQIMAALESVDQVDRVIHLRTLHVGPEELLVAAKIAVTHDDTAAEVARAINAAEKRIREVVPMARDIYLEPDLDRGQSSPPPGMTSPDS